MCIMFPTYWKSSFSQTFHHSFTSQKLKMLMQVELQLKLEEEEGTEENIS